MGFHSMLTCIRETFWAPSFWLPPNLTWNDLNKDGITYPDISYIFYALCFSVVIIIIRSCVERYIFLPIGIGKGLKLTKHNILRNHVLEKAYLSSHRGSLNHTQVQGLAKQLDWSVRQIERWLRKRKSNDKPPPLIKLMESGWRLTYYSFAFIFGAIILWDKPFSRNLDECWVNYPHQNTPMELNLYYGIQLSCYFSMIFSQFNDVKRKDFLEMFIHHLATILLISLSWTCNMVRAGSLILIIHDCSDIFMEAAKIFNYLGLQKACDTCFGIFFLVWVATRLVILPFYLTENIVFGSQKVFETFPAFNILKGLLLILLVLHTVWTYFILKILHGAVLSGKTEKDSRSSSSEISPDNQSAEANTDIQSSN